MRHYAAFGAFWNKPGPSKILAMARSRARNASWRPGRLLRMGNAQAASEEGITGAFALDADAPLEMLP